MSLAAFFGFTGIGLGAFGAHGLQNHFAEPNGTKNWNTAVQYHLLHSVAMLVIAIGFPVGGRAVVNGVNSALHKKQQQWVNRAYWSWACGVPCFSGSLYLLALKQQHDTETALVPKSVLGPTTPFGGLLMMMGWLFIGIALRVRV